MVESKFRFDDKVCFVKLIDVDVMINDLRVDTVDSPVIDGVD